MKIYAYIGSLLAFVAILAGTFYLGDRHGFDRCHIAMQEKIVEATKQARLEEQHKQEAVNATIQHQADNLAAINAQQQRDIDRLQQRESRRHLPKNTQAECKGATGAQLSRQDAGFLVREASRADTLREALKACYAYADTVSH